jgi:hypothetical protein
MAMHSGNRGTVYASTLVALMMVGNQVAGKATRDALFLSNFDITSLPTMLIIAALVSIVSVMLSSLLLRYLGPAVFVPRAFGVSALFLIGEWFLFGVNPKLTSVLLYLHIAAFGSILISGFWSVINESFDPRSGKKHISRIATGGTIGGLLGGVAAERVAIGLSVSSMLLILAAMHLVCLILLTWITKSREKDHSPQTSSQEMESNSISASFRILKERPYLKSLALMVLLGTMSAALIDYVFKAQASLAYRDPQNLLRFFAIYYTVVGLITVVLQGGLSRISLERLGLVRTVMILPGAMVLGIAGTLFSPRLVAFTVLRGTEITIRNSLYRSAYELLYTPVPPVEKRSTKPIIDVGFERLGDALGGGTVKLVLFLGPQLVHPLMLGFAALLSMIGLFVGRRLHKGYINALERSLQRRAVELEMSEVEDRTTRQTLVHTMASLNIDAIRSQVSQLEKDSAGAVTKQRGVERKLNPVLQELLLLQSGDLSEVKMILRRPRELNRLHVPQVVQLLAWDKVASDALRALRNSVSRIIGQLVDHLLDREQDFTIRRRIPLVLSASNDFRAIAGLLEGLRDPRFEVRFQCGRALSRIGQKNPDIEMDKGRVFDAVLREVAVDRRVWESHRLLDQFDAPEDQMPFIDEFLKDRANKSLEHVFTLLALVLPKEPLKISYLGLLTKDQNLRGTALEYLESVLPANIRSALWPYLDDERSTSPAQKPTKTKNEILDDLMKSNLSIQISLEEIRREEKRRNLDQTGD